MRLNVKVCKNKLIVLISVNPNSQKLSKLASGPLKIVTKFPTKHKHKKSLVTHKQGLQSYYTLLFFKIKKTR